MERIALTKHLYLDEVIDPFTYFTEKDNGISKIDLKLTPIFELLRNLYDKPLPINNWWNYAIESGINKNSTEAELLAFSDYIDDNRHIHQWSGYRSPKCKIGAKYSTHKLGQALDPKGNQLEMYKIVMKREKLFYKMGLREIEDPKITNGWLHISTSERYDNKKTIKIIGK